MSRKTNVSVRLEQTTVDKLQSLADETGLSLSDLGREAIARYLGEQVPTVGDRLTRLEREIENLKSRLRLIGN